MMLAPELLICRPFERLRSPALVVPGPVQIVPAHETVRNRTLVPDTSTHTLVFCAIASCRPRFRIDAISAAPAVSVDDRQYVRKLGIARAASKPITATTTMSSAIPKPCSFSRRFDMGNPRSIGAGPGLQLKRQTPLQRGWHGGGNYIQVLGWPEVGLIAGSSRRPPPGQGDPD